jgi:signal transduction histidine kinase
MTLTDSPEDIARDVAAVGRLEAVPTLLRVLCDTTGMGFAAVARVTDGTWTACAVQDDIQFGLRPGGQLDVHTTLCSEARAQRAPIVIDQASTDPRYCGHHTPRIYKIESYVSVPIILKDDEYFGNLCALDPRPARVSDPRVVQMFVRFAHLIGRQLDSERSREQAASALLDERAARELREQFIAILGHDLRNPLSAVGSNAALLALKADDGPTVRSIASRIQSNVKRMSTLIDDVLDFARGSLSGGIGIRLADVGDIGQALTAVVSELQDARPERTIAGLIDECPRIRCDRGRVQQLASNLLANALDHGAPEGTVRFTARADETHLVLQVANEGEPIPPEALDRIFRPFRRESVSANRQGLGLGLHICAQIVSAHGGTLTVTSSREAGTTFTARLPLSPAPA